MTLSRVLPTPFHLRTAEHNVANRWVTRGRFTVPAVFSSVTDEALAAHFGCILADVTPLERLRFSGERVARLLAAACGDAIMDLAVGASRRVYWTTEAGGVRGIARVARFDESDFLLVAADADLSWFAAAAEHFSATLRDQTGVQGMLMLAGPSAAPLLAASGLTDVAKLPPGQHVVRFWRGLTLRLSRWGIGFEIACAVADAPVLFDGLLCHGRDYGLTLAGQDAVDLLRLEAGQLTPNLDFTPARYAHEAEPSPAALGLHAGAAQHVLAAVACDSECTSFDTPLFRKPPASPHTREFLLTQPAIGSTLRTLYSPALRRSIGFAMLERPYAALGSELVQRRVTAQGIAESAVRVVPLPFLA